MSEPTRRDRLRPLELVGLSAGGALFVGLIVLLGTRRIEVAAIFFGVAFIVALVVLAMLLIAAAPVHQDQEPGPDGGPAPESGSAGSVAPDLPRGH